MSGLEFIAHLVGSLAWPVTVVLTAYLLRDPLSSLLPQLQHLKYKDFELDFEKSVVAVRTEIAQLSAVQEPLTLLPADDPLAKLADASPRAAVLEAWMEVEQSALSVARLVAGSEFTEQSLSGRVLGLLESQGVGSSVIGSLRELRALRNQAVHVPSFALSSDAARQYAVSTRTVKQYLRGFFAGR